MFIIQTIACLVYRIFELYGGVFYDEQTNKSSGERRPNGDGSFVTRGNRLYWRKTVCKDEHGKPIRKEFSGTTQRECRAAYEAWLKERDNDLQPTVSPDIKLGKWLELRCFVMKFSQRLEEIKSGSGLTNAKIGDICGVSEAAVRSWLSAAKTPSISVVEALSDYLQVSTDYLLGKSDIKNKPATINGDELSPELQELYDIFKTLSAAKRRKLIIQAQLEADEQNRAAER